MKIVIIGDGKVGYKLAKQLSVENYDVVLIDSNEKKLRYAIDRLDISCVTGDGADEGGVLLLFQGQAGAAASGLGTLLGADEGGDG